MPEYSLGVDSACCAISLFACSHRMEANGRFLMQILAELGNRLKMLHKLLEWHILNWLVSDTKKKE